MALTETKKIRRDADLSAIRGMEDIMKKIVSVKGVVKPVNRCEKCGEIIDNKIEGLEGNRHEDRDGEYWLCWVCKKIDEDLINR